MNKGDSADKIKFTTNTDGVSSPAVIGDTATTSKDLFVQAGTTIDSIKFSTARDFNKIAKLSIYHRLKPMM